MKALFGLTIALIGSAAPSLAQKPEVFPGGVVNAASLANVETTDYWVAAGSLVAIFGKNLAATPASATSFPLPKTLVGTSVTFGGISAPLLYVSPTQINAQVPSGFSVAPEPVVVATSSGSSDPVLVQRWVNRLGIFTLDGSGCGRAAVFNVAPDGTFSLNGPGNSVEPGSFLAVYGTGLFSNQVNPSVPDGDPAPADPPAQYKGSGNPIIASIGALHPDFEFAGVPFAGRAPGFSGLDQFNVRVPFTARDGCSIPLWLTDTQSSSSQAVPVSIRQGGGQCVDPPEQSIGILRWKKTVISGFSPASTEDLLIDFAAAPGKQPPGPPPATGGPHVVYPKGPDCRGFEDRALLAGALVAQPPGSARVQITPQVVDGRIAYVARLPAGTIREGSFTVTAAGGSDIGPFASSIDVPPPIEITSNFPPGSQIPHGPLTLRWKGGSAGTTVRVAIIRLGRNLVLYERQIWATASELPLASGQGQYEDCCNRLAVGDDPAEIIVTVRAEGGQDQPFQAPGLTLGGRHGWIYEFRFTDLKL